ncbi:hypothetical protein A2U01_0038870, partial [Trifolium medium]|nr:hypothetical protein [Trifolium medium]
GKHPSLLIAFIQQGEPSLIKPKRVLSCGRDRRERGRDHDRTRGDWTLVLQVFKDRIQLIIRIQLAVWFHKRYSLYAVDLDPIPDAPGKGGISMSNQDRSISEQNGFEPGLPLRFFTPVDKRLLQSLYLSCGRLQLKDSFLFK